MSESDGSVKEWLSKNRSKGIRLLQRLVQEPSTRGNEAGAQAVIIEKCREMGLELDIWEIGKDELPAHPLFCSDRKDFSGNPNVVGVWKGTGGGRSIILNGHIDVVPEGSRDDWKYDPYSGQIKDGRLYGRGATDMKGGTVSLLLALEYLIAAGKELKGDVIFQSVIEEESGGAGTLAAVIRGYKADGAIIPEPTNMKLFPKQQGSMWFRITVKGRAAHGGTRYEGISAIEKAIAVIASLQELEKTRNERVADPLYKGIPIPIPINIGKITSGEWPSSVPDTAVIEGRIGVAPEEDMKMAEKELETVINSLSEKDGWFIENPCKVEWFGGRWQPGNLDIGHPLMNVLSASFEKVAGEKPKIEASPWGTDGGILSGAGGTPVIVFGPGTTEAAHDADESISLDDMFNAAEIIAECILEWCS
ncbi:peptidase [Bacillus infantis]|uniref:peptidase n=1 Tax=Bacillus infantis TaxID=324767 RepID=UPI000B9A4611|nr:peptidase [Bacillus infantis]MCK6204788.1 peptidase [Bacillus infantis]OXT19455.1 acetylornithine deacetylase [Bacillus sp. OG2]